MAKLWWKLIASSALSNRTLSCWKMKSLEIRRMAGRSCCNSITWRLILLTKIDSVIDKCQTGLLSTTCDSPTDAISDWTLLCAGVLSRRLSSWLINVRTVGHSAGFWCGYCECLFVSEQNDAKIIRWTFLSNCFKWQSLAWKEVRFTQPWMIAIFEYKRFTR